MQIEYAKSAVKTINALEKICKTKYESKLTEVPPVGDIKPMQGYSDGRLRLRVGKYRIVYKYIVTNNVKSLHTMEIGSRGDIYK